MDYSGADMLMHEMRDRVAAKDAEIASLRAELAKMTAECERRFDGRANLLEVQLRLANELSERYSGAAHQDAEEKARLRAPYRNADEEDWRRLDDWIGHGGHGQFWRAVFKEVRSALACTPAEVPNGVQQTEEIARLREALEAVNAAGSRIPHWVQDKVRAALACCPQGKPHGD